MAVNIDISMLANRNFANELIARVQASGARAEQLILEVTESALMHDTAATLASVGRLRLAGFGLSIDDYGTGFSTLQQLTRLPFTELKIDRAFVTSAHRNRRSLAILQSAIDMSVRLRLPSIAEGVETIDEVRLLCGLAAAPRRATCSPARCPARRCWTGMPRMPARRRWKTGSGAEQLEQTLLHGHHFQSRQKAITGWGG